MPAATTPARPRGSKAHGPSTRWPVRGDGDPSGGRGKAAAAATEAYRPAAWHSRPQGIGFFEMGGAAAAEEAASERQG